MTYGAGVIAAREHGAARDRGSAPLRRGEHRRDLPQVPGTGPVLPAMGYGQAQIKDLEATVRATPCDVVIIGTPIDLRRLIAFDKPAVRVTYELAERGRPTWPSCWNPWPRPPAPDDRKENDLAHGDAHRPRLRLDARLRRRGADAMLELAGEVKANPDRYAHRALGKDALHVLREALAAHAGDVRGGDDAARRSRDLLHGGRRQDRRAGERRGRGPQPRAVGGRRHVPHLQPRAGAGPGAPRADPGHQRAHGPPPSLPGAGRLPDAAGGEGRSAGAAPGLRRGREQRRPLAAWRAAPGWACT